MTKKTFIKQSGLLSGSLLALGLAVTAPLQAEELRVSDQQQLAASFTLAKPGDVIVMKDGVWRDVVIDFNASATASAHITLRAETPGKVTLSGSSQLFFSKPYLDVEGLLFEGGAVEKDSVITFNADHCTLSHSAIIDYNPENFETSYYWVYFKGNSNRVVHSFFKGKNNLRPVIGNDNDNARYNLVGHSYFKDIPYIPNANGREIIRVFGYGHADETGDDGAYFTVEYNLFDHAHGEGTEIVSLKSNYNVVRFNTVRATRGGLVGRRGKHNTFEGNTVLGEGMKGTTGIRLAGAHHRVINNYISNVAQDGIRLISGEYTESLTGQFKTTPRRKTIPTYLQVVNAYIADNTIIDVGESGINIGYRYKAGWPDDQLVLLPEKNVIANNLIHQFGKAAIETAVQDKTAPLDIFSFEPNTFTGNIVSDAGDVGAIEYADRAPPQKPLVAADVGPDWMK